MADKYRARISLGHYATIEERDSAIAAAQALLGSPTSPQDSPQAAIADDVLDIPANVNLITTAPLRISAQKLIYASDIHVPYHDRLWIRRLVMVADKLGIDTLVIGGDLYDFSSVSRHPKTEQQATLNETLKIGGDLIVALGRYFQHIYLLPGNHDNRVASKLDQPLEFASLVHASIRGRLPNDRFTVTDLDYLYINEAESGWVVGHPRFFEGASANGLAKVALRERRNVIAAHTHVMSLSWTHDGRYTLIYPGCMTNPELTPYIMQSRGLSRFAEWRQGFVVIENDIPTLFSNSITDWSKYGI